MSNPREDAAVAYEAISQALRRAARHADVTAVHFRAGDVPRAGAHTVALMGDLEAAQALLSERLIVAARFADPGPDDQGS